ncbi:hypothetical protein MPLB_1460029 [Mesorhizobium sp. ORS 3324]|nr:hypothetical protein MPLB_1460029 [Mesorhizobium sp. ORS 3324]
MSREHQRAKTDRLDTELLMRAFLGGLRGEKRHCSMAAIPTLEEEDARRPNRERQTSVSEQTRLINRIKAILARFGIRSFRLSCAMRPTGSWPSTRRREHRYRTTPAPSCTACLSGSPSCVRRSAPSRATACAGSPWLRLHQKARMR